MSKNTVLQAAQRGAGLSDPDAYKRDTSDLLKGIAESRKALDKRARQIMQERGVGESYALSCARKEHDEALEARRSERNRSAYEHMARRNQEQPEENLRTAQERASVPRVRYQFNGDPEPGATVNDVIHDQARNRMSEKLWVYLHGGREALAELEGK